MHCAVVCYWAVHSVDLRCLQRWRIASIRPLSTLDHPRRPYAGISRPDNTPQSRDSRLYQGSSVAESYGSPLNGVIVLALALASQKVSQTTQKRWISSAGMGAGPTTLPLKEKQEFTKCYTGSRTDGFL